MQKISVPRLPEALQAPAPATTAGRLRQFMFPNDALQIAEMAATFRQAY
jgi:hypothetical protein